MQVRGVQPFIRFGADQPDKKIQLPKDVEKRLKEIAQKYNADVETAKQMYQSLKGLKNIKLTDDEIYNIIDGDLNPHGPRITTMALGEEGGDDFGPPSRVTQALHESGEPRDVAPPREDAPRRVTLALHESGGKQ